METSESTSKRAVWYIVGLNLIAAAVVLNIRYNVGVAAFSRLCTPFRRFTAFHSAPHPSSVI